MIQVTIDAPGEPARTIEVSPDVAERLQMLAGRGEHGVHVSKLGGIDALGELAALGIPFEAKAFVERGTGKRKCWITTATVISASDPQRL